MSGTLQNTVACCHQLPPPMNVIIWKTEVQPLENLIKKYWSKDKFKSGTSTKPSTASKKPWFRTNVAGESCQETSFVISISWDLNF